MFQGLLALTSRPGAMYRVSIPDGRVDPVLEDAGHIPDGVVLENGVIYWTTMGAPTIDPDIPGEAGMDFSARNGGVHAMGLGGTGRRDLTGLGAITTPKQLVSDGAGNLYWGDREGFRVSRVRIDGTALTDLVTNVPDDQGLCECVGVAVDRVRKQLYWTQKGPPDAGKGRIFRAGLDIPDGETAGNRSDIEVLWDGLPEPIDLEISGSRLYWTDRGAPPHGNTLNRAPLPRPGRSGAPPEILADGFCEAIGLAVDDEAGLAYVSDLGGQIRVVPLPGGPAAAGAPHVLAQLGGRATGLTGIPAASN